MEGYCIRRGLAGTSKESRLQEKERRVEYSQIGEFAWSGSQNYQKQTPKSKLI